MNSSLSFRRRSINRFPRLIAAFATALVLAFSVPVIAQTPTLTTLHSFAGVNGNHPAAALVQGSDGNFYGTTAVGGTNNNGTFFRVTPAGALTILHSFSYAEGSGSTNALIQGSNGNFYSTTSYGGANGNGTIFSITPTGALTVLYNFVSEGTGVSPSALVQGPDGNFYGTTYFNGIYGSEGTFFRVTPAGVYTVLHNFTGNNGEGANPGGILLGSDGNFYGTTNSGGYQVAGTVYRITPTGVLTTLHSFNDNDGDSPTGLIQGSDGNFYGTTSYGGANYDGTIFECTPAGVTTVLYNFTASNGGVGELPSLLVQGTDGSFYGTSAAESTTGYGEVFRFTPGVGLTVLHTFSVIDGSDPESALVLGRDGNFYGTTNSGGTNASYGTVFSITPGGALTSLASFAGADGAHPYAGLTRGSDGNFYGTTEGDGTLGYGTVFSVTPTGTLTVVYNFARTDGANPYGSLLLGTDGNFYGTTRNGGASAGGTVFQITPTGTLTTLHNFVPYGANDGANPAAGLIQGPDGAFYGTASSGGMYGGGTVFRITATGTYSTLFNFVAYGFDGSIPLAPLVLGSDGNFYGTTSYSGARDQIGTVFQLNLTGGLTTLHSFLRSEGGKPVSGLIQGVDGSFYGTTATYGYGDSSGTLGSVYEITAAGALTVVHRFTAAEGGHPRAGLILGDNGNFYGTTSLSGPGSQGTLFTMTPAGTLTVLHSFTGGTDGANPYGGLVEGADGNFYGTTEDTTSGYGTVFRLNLHGIVAFTATTATVNEGGNSVALTLTRTGSTTGAIGVNYSTVDSTAVAGTDYTPTSGTLTWSDGDATSRTIVVPIIDRLLTGGATRGFSVVLSQPSGGAALGNPATLAVSILDNDVIPAPVITSATIASGQIGKAFTYQITASNSPTSYAASGLPAGLSVNPTTGLISGTPTQMGTFGVSLSAINPGGSGMSTLTLAIAANLPVVTLVATTPTVTAGSGDIGEFTLTLSAPASTDTIVNFAIKGSAVNGSDYVLLKTTKKIKAGKVSKPIKITPLGGGAGAGVKRVVTLVLEPGTGYTVGTTSKVKVKIYGD